MALPEHSHCKFCGDPVSFDDDYCSEECGILFTNKAKKESKRTNMFFVLALTAVVVLSVIIYLF